MFRFAFAPGLAISLVLVVAAAPSGATGTTPRGRLPDTAVPQAYRLDLVVDPEKPRFSGSADIDITTSTATSALWIHGKNLHVASAIARVSGRIIRARYVQVDASGLAQVRFTRPLPAGKATLHFEYDAPFGSGPAGLYRAHVDGKWYVWSQFESIDARAAFPSFDQPGFKTPFTVSLTIPEGNVAIANAPEVRTVALKGGLERHVFAATKPLPTYLTAIAVGPFATASGQVVPSDQRATPLPLRVVATQSNRESLQFALANSAPIVAELEQYFGRPFPFPKLDQIASPLAPGAMENAGAVIYSEDELLLGKDPAIGQMQEFGVTVAHELAHQWFGDLVTPDWWSDIWLNESFANWLGYRVANAWRPDLKAGTSAIAQAFAAMDLDSLSAGRPIRQEIVDNGDIMSAFDPITYGKGGQVVAMIAAFMGDQGFRDGVRLHMARHAYGTATTEQFFRSLSDAAHDPRIAASLHSFVDQQGVPLIHVRRSGDTLVLTQSPYALLGSKPAARSWLIPFCYSAGGERRCTLMDKTTATIAAPGNGAIMPNAGGIGYYRFSLEDDNWESLVATAAQLPPGEAMALTDSLWAAFDAGEVPARLLIAEARTMLDNPYSAAAADPGNRLRALAKLGLIDASSLPAYRRMIHDLYAPKLAAIGFDPKVRAHADEDADRQKLRAQLVRLVGLDAADLAVRGQLVGAAKGWLAGDAQALDRTYAPNAFAAYLAAEGLPAAQIVYERALAGSDFYFRAVAMDAIARSGDQAIARWLVDRLDDPRLRPAERTRSVRLMMADSATREVAYSALLARFDELAKGSFGGVAELMSDPGGFCSAAAAARIERDLRPLVVRHTAGGLDLDRTLERVRHCDALSRAKSVELVRAFGG